MGEIQKNGSVDITMQIKKIAGKQRVVGQSDHLSEWLDYYQNDYAGLYYKVNNGQGGHIKLKKKCIGLPKKIGSDLANYVLNEKNQIVIPEASQKTLNNILTRENFWSRANKNYEQAAILSMGAWVVGIDNIEVDENGRLLSKNSKIKIRLINATKVFPLTARDGQIIECAFVSNQTTHYNVEIHMLNEKNEYIIRMCKISPDYVTILNEVTDFETHSKVPLFQIIHPNIANNINLNSSLPISVIANSLDVIESIDEKYDDFYTEFKNGKKRIFVNSSLWKVSNLDGEVVKAFDENDTVFYPLEFEDNSKPLIESSADPLRDESYVKAINSDLNILSMNMGFGRNYYNIQDITESSKTATEVKAMNNELMNTVQKHELVVKDALIGMVKAIQYLSNTFTDEPLGNFKEEDINVIFDDSVFEDKETEQLRDRTAVEAGLMSEVEYRMRWMGETEEDAKLYVYKNLRHRLIKNNLEALTAGAITPELFVAICYGDQDEAEQQKLIEYIKQERAKSSMIAYPDEYPTEE